MFKYLFILYTMCVLPQQANAQISYNEQMKRSIRVIDTATTFSTFKGLASYFENVAKSNPEKWEPLYYQAFCYLLIAIEKKDKNIDKWCDLAEPLIKKIEVLSPNNSENFVLKSLNSAARVSVNEFFRGPKYAPLIVKQADAAIALDNENPRAYLQKASAAFYTPEAFGGGAKKAKPIMEECIKKYQSFKKQNDISPDWGYSKAQNLMKEINAKLEKK